MKLTRRSFIRVLICCFVLVVVALYQLPQRLWFYFTTGDSLLAALAPSARKSVEVQSLVVELGQHPIARELQQIEIAPKLHGAQSREDSLEALREHLGKVPQVDSIELSNWVLSKNEATLLLQSAD